MQPAGPSAEGVERESGHGSCSPTFAPEPHHTTGLETTGSPFVEHNRPAGEGEAQLSSRGQQRLSTAAPAPPLERKDIIRSYVDKDSKP